jgi:hypothetical protein
MIRVHAWRLIGVLTLALVFAPTQVDSQAGSRYQIETRRPDGPDLRSRFAPSQIAILELLNRADAAHLARLDVLIVPAEWHTDMLTYSPFPSDYAWGADHPKLLIVDQRSQAFAAYEFGRQVRWGPVNTGRQATQTPAGLFHLNWPSRGRTSTVNPSWFLPWYYNFENRRGLSFHQYALPGRPASHACVRLLERDARWLFGWGEGWTLDARGWDVLEEGTPVVILGCYSFTEPTRAPLNPPSAAAPGWSWLRRSQTVPAA